MAFAMVPLQLFSLASMLSRVEQGNSNSLLAVLFGNLFRAVFAFDPDRTSVGSSVGKPSYDLMAGKPMALFGARCGGE